MSIVRKSPNESPDSTKSWPFAMKVEKANYVQRPQTFPRIFIVNGRPTPSK